MSGTAEKQPNDLLRIAQRMMVDRNLLPEFSTEVLEQTEGIKSAATPGPGVQDLRALLWTSIDNDDSRDLDQLTAAELLEDGQVRIVVAVADVDALVAQGTPIDSHAQANTTSVYTAAGVFPMLPEKLSTDLSSLGEGVERLALAIDLIIGPDGTVGSSELYRATVKNRAKLTYNGLAAWLDGQAPAPGPIADHPELQENLRLQDTVAQRMKRLRHKRGALSLDTMEVRPVFEGTLLADLRPDEENRAKEIIEDFMIAANGAVARFLRKRGYTSFRRVLRAPERWQRIVELARGLGSKLPAEPDAVALERFLLRRRAAEPEAFSDLSLAVVKLLGRGAYALELPGKHTHGHFGLAVRDYSHSTAPNRRFPDLITHRMVKAALEGKPAPYDDDDLAILAGHCTTQENNASKVERQVAKSAAALLLRERIGQHFDALVTGASEKGTWVRIAHPTVEGKVVRGERGLDVGDHVRVELVSVDPERGYINFVPAQRSKSR